MSLELYIGKNVAGQPLLVLAESDSDAKVAIAEFFSQEAADAFTIFMESQGFNAFDMLTQADLDELLKEPDSD